MVSATQNYVNLFFSDAYRFAHVHFWQVQLVLLRRHFFQGRSVSVGVSMQKSVVGLGFGIYTCVPSASESPDFMAL